MRFQNPYVDAWVERFDPSRTRVKNRFFDEDHPVVLRKAGHELLGALKHKVPAQVGKDDEGGHAMLLVK